MVDLKTFVEKKKQKGNAPAASLEVQKKLKKKRKVPQEENVTVDIPKKKKRKLAENEPENGQQTKPKRKRKKKVLDAKKVPVESIEEEKSQPKRKRNEEKESENGSPTVSQEKPKQNKKHSKNGKGEASLASEKRFIDRIIESAVKKYKTESGLRDWVNSLVDRKKIRINQKGNIIKGWKAQNRFPVASTDLEKLVQMDGTLEEVKTAVNALVEEGKLTYGEAANVINRWKKREQRRQERIEKRTGTCLRCRESGHTVSECPKADSHREGTGICFKCGSGEHAIYKCPRKDSVKGFPFATCFICHEGGHLSRDCAQNGNGVYPNGGCCNMCGSKMHLYKDCPDRIKSSKASEEISKKERTAVRFHAMKSGDEDDAEWAHEVEDVVVEGKSKKRVVFG